MTNANDSAFPQMREYIDMGSKGAKIEYSDTPLSKREYFAALAMQALLSDSQLNGYTPQQYAEGAVEYADALIEELNKPKDNGTD